MNELSLESANQQLVLVQNYVNKILDAAKNTSVMVANLDEAKNAVGKWTKYFELSEATLPGAAAVDPSEITLNRLANEFMKANPDFAYVYMGFEDGGYTQDGKEMINNDYDPRKRPWYQQCMASSADSTLLSAYITTMGVPNIGYTTKIRNAQGKAIGVSAVDISLGGLTKIIESIRVGKTGYVLLIQKDGKILSDPRNKENNFKTLGELGGSAYGRIAKTGDGTMDDLVINGVSYVADVLVSKETGWKLVALIDKSEISEASNKALTRVLLIGGIAILLFGALGGAYVTIGIYKPIGTLVGLTQKIAAGDFKALPDKVTFKSELLTLFENMKIMVQELVRNITAAQEHTRMAELESEKARKATAEAEEARMQAMSAKQEGLLQAAERVETVLERVVDAAQEMSVQSDEFLNDASRQSERIASTATAMEEMNMTVLEIARNASDAATAGKRSQENARNGAQVVEQSRLALEQTVQEVGNLKARMGELDNQAQSIGAIIGVINDIADQTNLLALNAAIEAARAGEAGRGFAVVADEVRKLAEKTMNATKEVSASIGAIQKTAGNNIVTMESLFHKMDEAEKNSTQSGVMLREIVTGAESSALQIQSIATAAEEQSATSEEINHSIEEINGITMETANRAQEFASSLQALSQQVADLKDIVEDLKTEGGRR
ncbi:MAG: methyl-accepting chemotaxis protein [Desulfovibrionaceae bacterium]|nr:methyl-accepting chemotaxis protein [Desulfovibrionaceae bacterium]